MKDVVSLETAVRLREAGWRQEAKKYYCADIGESTLSRCCAPEFKKATCGHHVALPDVGELFDGMPNGTSLNKIRLHNGGGYDARWMDEVSLSSGDPGKNIIVFSAYAPDALGNLWCEWVALKKRESSPT